MDLQLNILETLVINSFSYFRRISVILTLCLPILCCLLTVVSALTYTEGFFVVVGVTTTHLRYCWIPNLPTHFEVVELNFPFQCIQGLRIPTMSQHPPNWEDGAGLSLFYRSQTTNVARN